ncbi:MAG: TonB-dependent receptor [Steroidobacteraceae bacterium]
MNSKKTLSICAGASCILAAAGVNSAEPAPAPANDLEEVLVLGSRDLLPGELLERNARLGILGDKTVMDIPYSQMSMSSKMLELFNDPSQPLNNVLQNNPSIRSSTSSPMYSDFSMRGVNMNGNHMMLNGIPSLFSQFTTPPSHIIERIDITSGPNAAVNGVSMSNNGTDSGATPAPGTINVVTKSAPDTDINRVTGTFSGRSNVGAYVDVARRFGGDKNWGLRVNAEHLTGELSQPGADNNSRDIFFNLDHRSARSGTNLFAGYFDLRIDGGQRWFTFSGTGSELPRVPDSKMNYDFPETTKWQHGQIVTFNHEQRITANWSVFANFGSMDKSGYKYNSSAALRFNDAGSFVAANVSNAQVESTRNKYSQLGIRGSFETGALKHGVALAVDRSWAKYWNDTNNSPTGRIGGNLYDGVAYSPQFYPLPARRTAVLQWEETNVGITATDVISIGKVDVLLAASQKHEHFQNALNGQQIINDNVLPTYGITYKVSPQLSFYAGHTESFSRGAMVGNDSRYVNRGEVLSPVKASQNEIGVKLQRLGMLTTFAIFDMDQQNLIDVVVTPTTFRRAADGKNRYRGAEFSSVGQIADQWKLTAGALYLDTEREKTNGGTADGKFVNGVAKWSSTVGLEYRPIERVGLVGRVVYNGDSFIDSGTNGSTRIPSFVAFDVGANYAARFGSMPVRLNAMVFNAANKDYWMGRGGSTTFGLSMPRTVMFSAQVDF